VRRNVRKFVFGEKHRPNVTQKREENSKKPQNRENRGEKKRGGYGSSLNKTRPKEGAGLLAKSRGRDERQKIRKKNGTGPKKTSPRTFRPCRSLQDRDSEIKKSPIKKKEETAPLSHVKAQKKKP